MKIKNIGNRRIRLDKNLYLNPAQTIDVDNGIGDWAVKKNTDVIDITPNAPKKPVKKLVVKPKIKNTIKTNLEVKEDDIK